MTIPADLMPDMAPAPLADLMAEFDDPAATSTRWLITDDDQAEWSLRKLADAERAQAEIAEQAAEWTAQIEAWAAAQRKPHDRTIDFFRHHLADFARRRREGDPEAKTLSLPSGTVSSRLVPARPVVVDLDAFGAWCAANDHPEYLRVRVEAAAAELRKLTCLEEIVVGPEGEAVPGLGVEPSQLAYRVVATS